MEPPASLTAQLFLLGYDQRRQRIAGGQHHGLTLRAAALEELRLLGALADDAGKVRVTGQRRTDDPVLAPILRQVGESAKARPWKHWITKGVGPTYAAVREKLDDSLYIRLEYSRVLGIFPMTRAYVRDLGPITELRARVDRILAGSPPTARDAALVALAAAGELGTVLPRARRKAFKARIDELTAGPVPAALRRALLERKAAAASTAGG